MKDVTDRLVSLDCIFADRNNDGAHHCAGFVNRYRRDQCRCRCHKPGGPNEPRFALTEAGEQDVARRAISHASFTDQLTKHGTTKTHGKHSRGSRRGFIEFALISKSLTAALTAIALWGGSVALDQSSTIHNLRAGCVEINPDATHAQNYWHEGEIGLGLALVMPKRWKGPALTLWFGGNAWNHTRAAYQNRSIEPYCHR